MDPSECEPLRHQVKSKPGKELRRHNLKDCEWCVLNSVQHFCFQEKSLPCKAEPAKIGASFRWKREIRLGRKMVVRGNIPLPLIWEGGVIR